MSALQHPRDVSAPRGTRVAAAISSDGGHDGAIALPDAEAARAPHPVEGVAAPRPHALGHPAPHGVAAALGAHDARCRFGAERERVGEPRGEVFFGGGRDVAQRVHFVDPARGRVDAVEASPQEVA